jgi:hypothetical protein
MKEEGAKKTLTDVTRWLLFTSPGGRCRLHHISIVTDGHDYRGPPTRSQPSWEVWGANTSPLLPRDFAHLRLPRARVSPTPRAYVVCTVQTCRI